MWMLKYPIHKSGVEVEFRIHESLEGGLVAIPRPWLVEGTLDELRRYISVHYHHWNTAMPYEAKASCGSYTIGVVMPQKLLDNVDEQDAADELCRNNMRLPLYHSAKTRVGTIDSHPVLLIKSNLILPTVTNVVMPSGTVIKVSDSNWFGDSDKRYTLNVAYKKGFVLKYRRTSNKLNNEVTRWLEDWKAGKVSRLTMDLESIRSKLFGTPYKIVGKNGSEYNAYIIDTRDYNSAYLTTQDGWITLNPKKRMSHEAMANDLHLFTFGTHMRKCHVRFSVNNFVYTLKISVSVLGEKWYDGPGYIRTVNDWSQQKHNIEAVAFKVWQRRRNKMAADIKKSGFGIWGNTDMVIPTADMSQEMLKNVDEPDVATAFKKTLFSQHDVRRTVGRISEFIPGPIKPRVAEEKFMKFATPDSVYVKKVAKLTGDNRIVLDYNRMVEAHKWLTTMVEKYGHS